MWVRDRIYGFDVGCIVPLLLVAATAFDLFDEASAEATVNYFCLWQPGGICGRPAR